MSATTEQHAGVFLYDDPMPIDTNLSVDEIALRIEDAFSMGMRFIRLSTPMGDALVRPRAIVAVLPSTVRDGEDDDDDSD